MAQESELVRLEKFVGKLLENFRELKAENGRLQEELENRRVTIAALEDKLEVNDTERGEISNRVSKIIEQIEEWETDLGGDISQEGASSGDSSRQGSLFPLE
jgi:hypothetical protein